MKFRNLRDGIAYLHAARTLVAVGLLVVSGCALAGSPAIDAASSCDALSIMEQGSRYLQDAVDAMDAGDTALTSRSGQEALASGEALNEALRDFEGLDASDGQLLSSISIALEQTGSYLQGGGGGSAESQANARRSAEDVAAAVRKWSDRLKALSVDCGALPS